MRGGVVLAVAAVLAVAGCSDSESGGLEEQPVVSVSYDAGAVSVPTGEMLRVEFGWINPSIGDSWYLVGEADASVLAEIGSDTYEHPDCGDGMAGCDQGLNWEFKAVAPGETTVSFQYCYRSSPENCVGDDRGDDTAPPPPVHLTVEVTN